MGYTTSKALGSPAKGYAHTLENGYPSLAGIRPRGGSRRQATLENRAVRSLMAYKNGTTATMFAAAGTKIYNVTAPMSPTAPLTAVHTGLTSAEFSSLNFTGITNNFLFMVNGTDLHRTWDGTAWAVNTPAITGFSTANAIQCWRFGNRIWMVQKNSASAWYLPVDSIGGVATEFPVNFDKGGTLLFGATWSSDSGSGMGQRCVFVSSEGEAVIYQGNDPSSAATWSRVGSYEIGRPLHRNAWANIGGDLAVATVAGVVALSQVFTKDVAALSFTAITKEIVQDFKDKAQSNLTRPWSIVKWTEKGLFYIANGSPYSIGAIADVLDVTPSNWVVNSETGAWGKYIGWDIQCSLYFEGRVYFGSANGRVYAAEETGSDDGQYYTFRYAPWPDDFGTGGTFKTFKQARVTFTYSVPFNAQITVGTDYSFKWLPAPSAAPNSENVSQWDSGIKWDSGAKWDARGIRKVDARWRSIGRSGYVCSPMMQMTFANISAPDVELTVGQYTYETGDLVV